MKSLIAVLLLLFPCAVVAAPNLVAEINMDVRASTAAAAKKDATESAVRSGAIQVLSRYSDRAVVENLIMGADDSVIQNLVAATSITSEKTSKTAYAAKFSITIDRGALEKWYADNNVLNFLSAADESKEKSLVSIELINGLADWMALNQIVRESGEDYGMTLRSIFRNNATAYILTGKKRKFHTLCLSSGWSVSSRDGVLKIARY